MYKLRYTPTFHFVGTGTVVRSRPTFDEHSFGHYFSLAEEDNDDLMAWVYNAIVCCRTIMNNEEEEGEN